MRPIRVLHVGLGPIGVAALQQVLSSDRFRSVGGVDLDPALIGLDLGAVAGLSRTGARVQRDLAKALFSTRPDVVIHCTSSSIARVTPELKTILDARVAIVSTTEELAYPWRTHASEGRRVDTMARRAGVAVLGTGVNPGFAMDALPIALTAACSEVSRVRISRVQDARMRRLPFQMKIGAGLTTLEFRRRVRAGTVRHVGITESISMIGDALGWRLDRITDRVRPKIATRPVASRFLRVKTGHVAGIVQDGAGYWKGRALIRLHMEAYLGAPDTYDEVEISGVPKISMRIGTGLHGDLATPSLVVNSILSVLAAPPGLHTMRSLPLPSFSPR